MNGLSYEYMFISKRCNCKNKCCSSSKNIKGLIKDLNLLSTRSRLDILFLLKDKPHCVNDIMAHTELSQSLVSHHLSDLLASGFIESKREGKFIDYFLTKKGEQAIRGLGEMFK